MRIPTARPASRRGITTRRHSPPSASTTRRCEAFEEVATRAGAASLYGRMALFGKADTQARAGQMDAAIATWQGLASSTDEALPKDAVLMELGKAYQAAAETRRSPQDLHADRRGAPDVAVHGRSAGRARELNHETHEDHENQSFASSWPSWLVLLHVLQPQEIGLRRQTQAADVRPRHGDVGLVPEADVRDVLGDDLLHVAVIACGDPRRSWPSWPGRSDRSTSGLL